MSASHRDKVDRLGEYAENDVSTRGLKLTLSPATRHAAIKETAFEKQIYEIAQNISKTAAGHREAMYQGAARCALIARQIIPNADQADQLFDGNLKRHWLKKNRDNLEIYRFLIQVAFSEPKQASKVFRSTQRMFMSNKGPSEFIRRLRKYGGFEGLRKKDTLTDVKEEGIEGSKGERY